MTKVEWVRTFRTVIQAVIATAAVVPVLVPAVGLSTTAGVGAILIATAGVVARLMQIPAVSMFVDRLLRSDELK